MATDFTEYFPTTLGGVSRPVATREGNNSLGVLADLASRGLGAFEQNLEGQAVLGARKERAARQSAEDFAETFAAEAETPHAPPFIDGEKSFLLPEEGQPPDHRTYSALLPTSAGYPEICPPLPSATSS